MSPIKSTIKQILKTISKHASAHVFVGADPCVCPHQINIPSNHKSPTPSSPNVLIGNPLFNKIKSKIINV
ncbi:MAG: hypothetical protein LBV16_09675, partial [Elusimicrobiota bacterium]|nr:hypothetical protein [Elusimicrobiota bacterium]